MTTEIRLPFKPIFQHRMLSGQKTCTSRTRKYGEIGDTFKVFGATFQITSVYQYRLENIAYLLHDQEGFETARGFIECWKRIHPRRGYDPSQEVWVHEFKKNERGRE